MKTNWLAQFKQHNQIKLLDIHLAQFLTQQAQFDDELMATRFSFLILLLSTEVRTGHVCVDLSRLNQTTIDAAIWPLLESPAYQDWQASLHYAGQHQVVSDGKSHPTPLIFVNDKLYFHRMWTDEKQVAHYFDHNASFSHDVKTTLDQLFKQQTLDIDWQKVAVAVALTRKVSIISGGPGTGKTTTVAKILAAIKITQPEARIVAAAPTGKAASRLTESLSHAIDELGLASLEISAEAQTLHRLLGAKVDERSFTYDKQNPLHVDVLVVDEASMVDLNMMARIIDALPTDARLILLGDKDQLSSVEAGAVFGDLCEFIESGYSKARAKELSQLTNYPIPADHEMQTIADSICLLQKSYRFTESSGIGLLASAVKEGNVMQAKKLFANAAFSDICYHPIASSTDYYALLQTSAQYYQGYLTTIKQQGITDIGKILAQFANYRVLCAVREGPFGVDGLNKQIELLLAEKLLIKLKPHESWYIGRPIMILKNSAQLGLYNGDIGITLLSEKDKSKLRVYFPFPDGTIKGFSPSRLPAHETAYVMTVHKSQGSEFDHINLVLPTEYSPLLNRALLYTAITRAKKSVSVHASDSVLSQTIKTQTERQSGLIDLLREKWH